MKRKDFTKKHFAVKRSTSRQYLILSLCLILFSVGIAFCVFQSRQSALPLSMMTAMVSQIKTWMITHKNHVEKKLVKSKHPFIKQDDAKPPVHFEFYTALPNMKITEAKISNADELEKDLSTTIEERKNKIEAINKKGLKNTKT